MKSRGEVNIYNKDQVYFYIENGFRPHYIGVNKYKNNMVYFKFNMDDTQDIYIENGVITSSSYLFPWY